MLEGHEQTPEREARGRDTGVARKRSHRASSVASAAAALALVTLIALPAAVETWLAPEGESPAPADSTQPAAEPLRLVQDVLAPPAKGPKPDVDAMARQIGLLGDCVIPTVVGMACGELPFPEAARGADGGDIHPLALANQQPVLFASLRHFRSRDLVRHLRSAGTGDAAVEKRLVVARMLGIVGTPDALSALLDVMDGIESLNLSRAYVQSTIEEAIAKCLAHDPACTRTLGHATRECNYAALPLMARALGRTRGMASAALLTKLLGRGPEVDRVVIQELGRVARQSGFALPEVDLRELRRLLDSPDARVQRSAIAVLGDLNDHASFDKLLLRMADKDELVARAARASLTTMVGSDLGADVESWNAWRDGEETWWKDQAPALLADLKSEDPSRVFAALSALISRRFFRHDIAHAIGPLAEHPRVEVASSAIQALERLGSGQAAPWLVRALMIDDERRPIAGRALRTLTGLDLAPEYALWVAALPESEQTN